MLRWMLVSGGMKDDEQQCNNSLGGKAPPIKPARRCALKSGNRSRNILVLTLN
jgi:hypothetical protein